MALTKYNYNSFDVTPVASNAFAFNSTPNGLTTAASGAMNLISTSTVSSGVSAVSIASGINSTYDTYMFKFINIHPAAAEHFQFQASTDTGSSYGVTLTSTYFHATQNEAGNSTSLSYVAGKDLAQSTSFLRLIDSTSTANDESGSGTLFLFSPSNTTFVKHFISRTSQAATGAKDGFVAGYFNTTSAIDAIQFKMSSGNIDSGVIKMYGLAK